MAGVITPTIIHAQMLFIIAILRKIEWLSASCSRRSRTSRIPTALYDDRAESKNASYEFSAVRTESFVVIRRKGYALLFAEELALVVARNGLIAFVALESKAL